MRINKQIMNRCENIPLDGQPVDRYGHKPINRSKDMKSKHLNIRQRDEEIDR